MLGFDATVAFPRFRLEAQFDVARGEILALVGANGSGKTTCLHLIAGLLRPERARILLRDRVLCDTRRDIDLPPERRRVGLVFQDGALFPHLSVHANVRYGTRDPSAVQEWMRRLDLEDLARERIARLSGGQRQRVALARTLAAAPEALLLDEPLASMDVRSRAAVRRELREFLRIVGLPTIVVTHDPIDAFALADRIVALEDGRITQTGSPEKLLHDPRSSFVAELAGLNLLHAKLAPGTGLRVAKAGALELRVVTDAAPGEVFLSFRPSDVALSIARPEGSPQNVFRATVREVLPLPDRARIALEAGEPLLADVTREALDSLGIVPGRTVWATIKATAIRINE